MNAEAVTFEADGAVGTITLANPPANALGTPIVEGLGPALGAAAAARVKALVVRSSLDGYFVAGADIKRMDGVDRGGLERYMAELRAPLERLAALDCVSIAAIDGYALGGGLELAMACTLRVAARDAKLGLPEVKLGILPAAGGTQRLPRLVGRGRALDMILTGRSLDAAEAHGWGLVDRLADPGGAEAAALELAEQVAALSLPALAAIVRCVDAAQSEPLDAGFALEGREILDLLSEGEAAEGLRAFVEKRPARFS